MLSSTLVILLSCYVKLILSENTESFCNSLNESQCFSYQNISCVWSHTLLKCLKSEYNNDFCLSFTNCYKCSEQLGCGWCGTVCLSGNSSGPNEGSMFCPDWTYDWNECSNLDCGTYADCFSCTRQKILGEPNKGCGWCSGVNPGTLNCQMGTNEGSSNGCTGGAWKFSMDYCTDSLQCSAYNDCESCINDESMMCGWCATNRRCINANIRNQPFNFNCSDWRYGTCEASCYARSESCGNCILDPHCGWCGQFCTPGNKSGPSFYPNTYCSPWSYSSCDTKRCEEQSNCFSCKEKGCHWCSNSLSGVSSCTPIFSIGCCNDCNSCMVPLVPGQEGNSQVSS
eukprot:TRINITY_DN740_c0_g1_i2.p1 TRINITY_DN740_c0_g1~~TRINITY_DN740_c0_g1_i2.p1  ORF type:complete len:341 (-),score=5.55 TRINITY_DN740_c0_g1_i2:416-1438(-)